MDFDIEPKQVLDEDNIDINYDEVLLKQEIGAKLIVDKYKDYVSTISAKRTINYHTLESISSYLPQLVALEFVNIAIPVSSFQIVLDGLPNLIDLSLVGIIVTLPPENYPNFDLSLPSLIQKFICNSCHIIKCVPMHPIRLINHTNKIIRMHFPVFDISKLKFNNLKEFGFSSSEDYNIDRFNQFLKNNTSISKITMQVKLLNNESYKIFNSNFNLTIFKIAFDYYSIQQNFVNVPILYNIKYLNVNLGNDTGCELAIDLINRCPNLEYLTRTYHYEREKDLILLIEPLKKLKKLRLVNIGYRVTPLISVYPISNLETIKLYKFNYFDINLNLFSNLKCLRNVKINILQDGHKNNPKELIRYFSIYKEWKVLIFDDVIQLWKL